MSEPLNKELLSKVVGGVNEPEEPYEVPAAGNLGPVLSIYCPTCQKDVLDSECTIHYNALIKGERSASRSFYVYHNICLGTVNVNADRTLH